MEVVVGRIVKGHGVRGEVVVESRTDSPGQRFAPGVVLNARARDGSARTVTITSARPHGTRMLICFGEVTDRDEAERLCGSTLHIDTAELEKIEDPDEFHDHQLEGLRAERVDGTVAGTVTEVVHAPGGELLVVGNGEASSLVPFVRQIVTEVDLTQGRIVLDPPEGLLDDE